MDALRWNSVETDTTEIEYVEELRATPLLQTKGQVPHQQSVKSRLRTLGVMTANPSSQSDTVANTTNATRERHETQLNCKRKSTDSVHMYLEDDRCSACIKKNLDFCEVIITRRRRCCTYCRETRVRCSKVIHLTPRRTRRNPCLERGQRASGDEAGRARKRRREDEVQASTSAQAAGSSNSRVHPSTTSTSAARPKYTVIGPPGGGRPGRHRGPPPGINAIALARATAAGLQLHRNTPVAQLSGNIGTTNGPADANSSKRRRGPPPGINAIALARAMAAREQTPMERNAPARPADKPSPKLVRVQTQLQLINGILGMVQDSVKELAIEIDHQKESA
ncbi:hypothetical protein A0H81_04234 [Grifola frondosa]|uniref:Uncharacterized protein n=1 Tax=Grifola frondosa TaxID=5627 RepID=A0A1C7MFF5_GRIFR|nr:hypothetical protein A0H81_04234 [Grifola frondosa]